MIEVKSKKIILEKTDLNFENQAVLNPACIEKDGIVHMFYRAVRPGNFSTIGYCQIKNGEIIYRKNQPCLYPEYDYETQGLEDPRITFLDGLYYLFYTAFDGRNARIAYAVSPDLKHFEKRGVISPQIPYQKAIDIFFNIGVKKEYVVGKTLCEAIGGANIMLWDKDACLFPKKINGQYALLHRILPDIQIAYFTNFSQLTDDYWLNYLQNLKKYILLEPRFDFESRSIGAGTPPIETPYGWLLIYHAVQETADGAVYHAGAALLDKDNPQRLIGRLTQPLFSPDKSWEKLGNINNIVFPTGAVLKKDKIEIYYGAADKVIGCCTVDLPTLLTLLTNSGSSPQP